jgi:hypothetical protein
MASRVQFDARNFKFNREKCLLTPRCPVLDYRRHFNSRALQQELVPYGQSQGMALPVVSPMLLDPLVVLNFHIHQHNRWLIQ